MAQPQTLCNRMKAEAEVVCRIKCRAVLVSVNFGCFTPTGVNTSIVMLSEKQPSRHELAQKSGKTSTTPGVVSQLTAVILDLVL